MNKFIETNTSNHSLKNSQWRDHCGQKDIPCVVVKSNGSTANVDWDSLTYPMGSEELFNQNDAFLKAELRKIYDKYLTKKSTFSISCMNVLFTGLPIEGAKAAANDIFDLINSQQRSSV